MEDLVSVTIQFSSEHGEVLGNALVVPAAINDHQLQQLCSELLKDETVQCQFFVEGQLITSSLSETLRGLKQPSNFYAEHVISVVYEPQASFHVQAVTRCTSSIPGHGEAIVAVAFSPDGRYLASGSGDTTVRFWDVNTQTPQFTCRAHSNWVLCIAWAPDGKHLASACKNGHICIWNPATGEQVGRTLLAHKKWITSLAWEPLHVSGESRLLASASKDGDARIWDVTLAQCVRVLSGHTASVTCLRWGGEGLIYTASQDRTVRVWRAVDGVLCRTLKGHGHWVNTMALSTDYAVRTGAFDPAEGDAGVLPLDASPSQLQLRARARYEAAIEKDTGDQRERLVTGSDDFTLFLWAPNGDKKPIARMTGHMQLVNHVLFSPDGRLIASASFDKSVKLWCGRTGRFIATLRGHVQAVYQVAWSADSRLLLSSSADSTMKAWDAKTHRLAVDLPGHADEVYAVDWSPDGQRVASGGKDKVLKLWRQ